MTADVDAAGRERVLTLADRVTQQQAKSHFEAGGAVLVSEDGHETTYPVRLDTTFHTRETITWDSLTAEVNSWRNRWPNQRFYNLRPVDSVTVSRELCTLLREHARDVFNTRLGDWLVTEQQSRDASLAHTLSVLLVSAIAS